MNKLASNPILLIVLGLVLGVGSGLGWFWTAAAPLVREVRAAKVTKVTSAQPEAPWDFWTIEIENVANELKDVRVMLKKREEELAAREARLITERQELVKQRVEVEALRTEISSKMTEIQSDELKNLKNLTALYSNLTPKATLTVFNEMDEVTVVKLLALMKTDVLGPLFEEMSKQAAVDPTLAKRAADLTERLRLYKAAKPGAKP